jgi:hypothetical protein
LTLGLLAGLPGSWLALKVWLPPYKMASDTLRLIQEGERLAQSSTAAQDTERPGASTPLEPIEPLEVEIVMTEKLEDFLDHLRIALAPLQ